MSFRELTLVFTGAERGEREAGERGVCAVELCCASPINAATGTVTASGEHAPIGLLLGRGAMAWGGGWVTSDANGSTTQQTGFGPIVDSSRPQGGQGGIGLGSEYRRTLRRCLGCPGGWRWRGWLSTAGQARASVGKGPAVELCVVGLPPRAPGRARPGPCQR